jgi:hypothetical protein
MSKHIKVFPKASEVDNFSQILHEVASGFPIPVHIGTTVVAIAKSVVTVLVIFWKNSRKLVSFVTGTVLKTIFKYLRD